MKTYRFALTLMVALAAAGCNRNDPAGAPGAATQPAGSTSGTFNTSGTTGPGASPVEPAGALPPAAPQPADAASGSAGTGTPPSAAISSTGAGAAGTGAVAAGGAGHTTYAATCFACHGTGVAGAPKLGDKADWGPRIARGKNELYQHAINGYTGQKGVMPPKGGNTALPDADVRAAVDHMVAQVQ